MTANPANNPRPEVTSRGGRKEGKRFLFLIDDGWRYEKREILHYLRGKISFDVATHHEATRRWLSPDFKVIKLEPHPIQGTISYTLLMFFAKELDTYTVKRRRRMFLYNAPLYHRALQLVRDLLGLLHLRPFSYHRALHFLYRKSRCYEATFRDYDVLLFNPVHIMDKRVVYEAQRAGLEIVSWVYSWDNPMKDNEFMPDADRYLVWNRQTGDQLRTLHRIPEERIEIVGPVQFDYLLENRRRPERESARRYVLFACSMGIDFQIEQEVRLILALRRMLDEIDPAVGLVIRPYPFSRNENAYRALQGRSGIELASFGAFDDWKIEITRQDLDDKYHQIREAACFVNIGSTIVLEASFTGTPVLQLNFNLPNNYPVWKDITEVLKNNHFRFILDSRFPNIIGSEAALRAALEEILSGGGTRYAAYSKMLQEFAHPLDVESYKEVFCEKLRSL